MPCYYARVQGGASNGGRTTMPINDLEDFIQIAQRGSFGKAADSMFMTQSGMSKKVARLEERLGFSLFDRNTRSNELTPAGRIFYKGAIEIVGLYNDVVQHAREVSKQGRPVVHVGGDFSNVLAFSAAGILRGRVESAGLPFSVELDGGSGSVGVTPIERDGSIRRLMAKKYDLAIALVDDEVRKADVVTRDLFKDRLVFCVSSSSGFEDMQEIGLVDLKDYVFVEPTGWPVMNREVERLCIQAGFKPRRRVRYIESMGHLIVEGAPDEVIVTTLSMIQFVAPPKVSGLVKLRCADEDAYVTYAAVYRRDGETEEVRRCCALLGEATEAW